MTMTPKEFENFMRNHAQMATSIDVFGVGTSFAVCVGVAFAMGVLLWGIGVRIGLVAW